MLPIRDRNPSGRTPCVTWALIALNVAVFLAYFPAGTAQSVQEVYDTWGMVPNSLWHGGGWHSLLTAMFVHGGWLHLFLNMLFLRIFGDNLEAELGRLRFLGFYLVSGLVAFGLQFLAAPLSAVPVAGASGAVAGVMGGYLLMFPRARVVTLLYFVVGFRSVVVPAWALLSLWFLVQIWGGMTTSASGSVAFWAHVGGFLMGVILCVRPWRLRGAALFWHRFHGLPPHPQALVSIPVVRRAGASLPPPRPHGLFRRAGARG